MRKRVVIGREQGWFFRPAEADDLNFIYSTWIKSFRLGSRLGLASGKHTYFTIYQLIIDQILAREDCRATVAALKDEPSVICGYVIHEPGVIHYVFTKEEFRHFGVARTLCGAIMPDFGPILITHKTKHILGFLKDHPEFVYRPSRLFPKGAIADGAS